MRRIVNFCFSFFLCLVFFACALQACLYPMPYRREVEGLSSCPAFLYAVIKTESGFRADAVSGAGAIGLMQILPSTAAFMRERYHMDEGSLFDPHYNLLIGAKYLSYLENRFSDLDTVIMAYNAGEGRVSLWLKDKRYSPDGKKLTSTPFAETNAYLKKVKKNFLIYRIFYRKTLDLFSELL